MIKNKILPPESKSFTFKKPPIDSKPDFSEIDLSSKEDEDKRFGRIMTIIMNVMDLEERHSSMRYEEYREAVLELDMCLKQKYCEAKNE